MFKGLNVRIILAHNGLEVLDVYKTHPVIVFEFMGYKNAL